MPLAPLMCNTTEGTVANKSKFRRKLTGPAAEIQEQWFA